MTCSRSPLLLAALAVLSIAACKKVDALEPYRKQCQDLQASGNLRKGLAVDDCAKSLKEAADENDPKKRAEELATRMQGLISQGAAKNGPQQEELRVAILELQALGKPAVPVVQSHLEATRDSDLRIAFARALVGICFDDCQQQKFDCIVPALMEGMTADKPPEVRQVAVAGLSRCSGKEYGDDATAWNNWYASVKPH